MPLLNPDQFRARLHADLPDSLLSSASIQLPKIPTTFDAYPALHPALIATVLAWGSKFSAHPILDMDRKENKDRSRISKMLFEKTLEIAEAEKVHRIPSSDHVIISLLLEPLLGRE